MLQIAEISRVYAWNKKTKCTFLDKFFQKQPPEVFYKKVVLKGLRPAALSKKETLAHVFSCEFRKIFKNTFFYRTPPDDCFFFFRNYLTHFMPLVSFYTPLKSQVFWYLQEYEMKTLARNSYSSICTLSLQLLHRLLFH